ncbi:MAG: winged helix-turn-helix transcriptional regulator [Thaumarchaeota archaeon]|nr:winged helix-turn-helix transcriptional regulator [Nitrososphaerota archaeon]
MPEVKEGYIRLLVELIGLGAKDGPVEATTKSLAERIGKSQQTLSLYLRRLEEEGHDRRAQGSPE